MTEEEALERFWAGQNRKIKLIAKEGNSWFDIGTEVLNLKGENFTVKEFIDWKNAGIILCRGQGLLGEVINRFCHLNQFDIEVL